MRFVMVLMCALAGVCVASDERYYPTVDAQGRIQVIKSEQSPTPVISTPVIKNNTIIEPVEQTEKKEPRSNDKQLESMQGTRQLDAETYIDIELLEKKNFNIDEKKRFYYLPNGGVGAQIIESKESIAVSPLVVPVVEKPLSYVSSNYLMLSKAEVLQYFPQQTECLTEKIIKKRSKPFKSVNNVWVQASLKENSLEIDALLRFTKETSALTQIRIVSFATTQTKSNYYLPIVIFLDNKGCTLSAAWQYWSRAYTATETQYASVDGLLNVPSQTAYVLFYRPSNTFKADIPLSLESGSFVVEAY
ncbi:MAG: putative pilus assembly protein FilE [Agitococcus sp.]|jgi:hypothetical protein|nr:putative pilus assembly protein FilE [Agitococcus sp.]